MSQHDYAKGQVVQVKQNGKLVEAVYEGWHDAYDMAIVIAGGKRLYRKIHATTGAMVDRNAPEIPLKQSRFNVNQRFTFIETLVDMVISGDSKSVIVSGSGGLGKTFTVMSRIKLAALEDVNDEDVDGGDFIVIKGFTTPKALYRLLYVNRDRIVIFDDCDSVWDNPTSVSLLKAALDSYETRRLAWLSELKPGGDDDDLPQSFEFTGKIIFVSNLSLTQLDQAVLSRSLYVDVSMTPREKVERIRAISKDIRPDMPRDQRDEALDFLEGMAEQVGDLNIRTYLKVLEMRHRDGPDWKDLAEYVITAL